MGVNKFDDRYNIIYSLGKAWAKKEGFFVIHDYLSLSAYNK
jgi:hypothetical protein